MVGELQQQYVQPVQQPAEESFWDGTIGDIAWGIAKWVGIGLLVLGTAGGAIFFIPSLKEALNKALGDKGGDKLSYSLFEAPILNPIKSLLHGDNEAKTQEVVGRVKIGDVLLPNPSEDWLNSDIFQKPKKFQKLANLSVELKNAELKPSDSTIFSSVGETSGMAVNDIGKLRKDAETFASATEKWDAEALLYQKDAGKIKTVKGNDLTIPVIDINSRVKKALGDNHFSPEMQTYLSQKFGLDDWGNKSITKQVFALSNQLDSDLEHTKSTFESYKKPYTNYTGYEGKGAIYSWYEPSALLDMQPAFPSGSGNMLNVEEGVRKELLADLRAENYPLASERVQQVITFFQNKLAASGEEADKQAMDYFNNFKNYIDTLTLKKELMPVLQTTYQTITNTAATAKDSLQSYADDIALLQEQQDIKNGKQKIAQLKQNLNANTDKSRVSEVVEQPNVPDNVDKKAVGK